MNELQKLMDDIREWSDATFGEGQRTIPILHHLIKEVPEAIEACKRFPHKNSVGYWEFADCLMLILDAANHYGMDADHLLQFTKLKLEMNKKRKWGKPDENGVVEHIHEEPEMRDCTCIICGKTFRANCKAEICPTCYV